MSAGLTPESRPLIGLMVRDAVRAEGLAALLAERAQLVAITPAEAVHDAQLSAVIIDADETIFTVLAAFRRARAGLRLIVFGHEMDPRHIGRVVAAGAKAYLSYAASADEILAALAVVQDGSIWAPRKVLASLIDTYAPEQPRSAAVQFSDRERQILELLVAGRSDREIAETLQRSPRTIQSAVSRLLRKVGVANRVALTVRVIEQHVLPAR